MTNSLPTKLDFFVVAESLRQEMHGRVSILGAYALGQILINPDEPLPINLPIAIYALFREGQGTFRQRLRIVGPSGQEIGNFPMPSISKKDREVLAVGINFSMMALPEIGTYKVEIWLDDQKFDSEFSIMRSETRLG
jgi:hypothetical protein